MSDLHQDLKELRDTSEAAAEFARTIGNRLISKPSLAGLGRDTMGDSTFQQVLRVRADLRAALASVEDGVEAVQKWRKE